MSPEALNVLLVDDDQRLAELVAEYLEGHGVLVTRASDGPGAVRAAVATDFDAIVLDWVLPGTQGAEVCRTIRRHRSVPILVITARQEEADRILGLELGADDFITKPFSLRELLARIRSNVRRASGNLLSERVVTVGAMKLFVESKHCTIDDTPIPLTASEFDLLRALAERRNRALSREALLLAMKGDASLVFDRSIDVLIYRLRAKIDADPARPSYLRTIRGAGYMLCDPPR